MHARNESKAQAAREGVPGAEAVLIGDLARIEETKQLAAEVNALGRFEAVIHNAGVYGASGSELLAVNVLAPYLLTCLIQKPQRLIYLSSDMHRQGNPSPKPITSGRGSLTYSDSKLFVVLLMKAVARHWPGVCANAVDPGWVPTRMGGQGAPDDLEQGYETQAWLAVSNDPHARVSGRYFFHKREADYHPAADNTEFQDKILAACAHITGVRLPPAGTH